MRDNIPTFDQFADVVEEAVRLKAELSKERAKSAKLDNLIQLLKKHATIAKGTLELSMALAEYVATRD